METMRPDDEDEVRDLLRSAYPPFDDGTRKQLRERLVTAIALATDGPSAGPVGEGVRVRAPRKPGLFVGALRRPPPWQWATPIIAAVLVAAVIIPLAPLLDGRNHHGTYDRYRVPSRPSNASCAGGRGALRQAIAWGHVVFVGTVTALEKNGTTATVRVDDVWKGDNVPAITHVEGALGAESRYFEVGATYLFIPDNTPPPYHASVCGTWPYNPSLASVRPPGAHAPTSSRSGPSGGHGG